MSTKFQYRLQQLESTVPADSWKIIADRLDNEFHVEDSRVSEKMTGELQPVPAGIWDSISRELDDNPRVDSTLIIDQPVSPEVSPGIVPAARVIRFTMPRLAAAAAVAILLGLTATWYLNNANRGQQSQIVDVANTPAEPSASQVLTDDNVTTAGIAAAIPSFRVSKPRKQARPGKNISFAVARNISDVSDSYSERDINYSDIDQTDQTQDKDPINIPTNPIRDAEGRIIMDEKLVSAPDVNYVTVTGPNGEQTKISKKFMHALSYMNSGNAEDDYLGVMMQEGSLWKWLFQEWRAKLLNQPSFIPTATNFLDIMELKELLHENF